MLLVLCPYSEKYLIGVKRSTYVKRYNQGHKIIFLSSSYVLTYSKKDCGIGVFGRSELNIINKTC